METMFESEVREMDCRSRDGIDVMLLWNPRTNRVFVAVVDERKGYRFRIEVDAADALDAFHDPYAYDIRRDHDEYTLA